MSQILYADLQSFDCSKVLHVDQRDLYQNEQSRRRALGDLI